jgi:hypothetical protein
MEMRFNLEPSTRRAVSTYVETFILLAVAIAGSSMVYAATSNYTTAAQGPAVAVSDCIIKQGSNVAIERMVLANTGTITFSSFTILTSGIPSNQFYITLTNAANGAPIAASPPSGTTPASITEAVSIPPGQSVLVSITIVSPNEFTLGTRYSIIVNTSPAAQQQVLVLPVPA